MYFNFHISQSLSFIEYYRLEVWVILVLGCFVGSAIREIATVVIVASKELCIPRFSYS